MRNSTKKGSNSAQIALCRSLADYSPLGVFGPWLRIPRHVRVGDSEKRRNVRLDTLVQPTHFARRDHRAAQERSIGGVVEGCGSMVGPKRSRYFPVPSRLPYKL
jgi:hypothetical protein